MDESVEIRAPMQAVVVGIRTEAGRKVSAGQAVVILEAMKMEHVVSVEQSGVVQEVFVKADQMVSAGDPLLRLAPSQDAEIVAEDRTVESLDAIRPDLEEVRRRHAFGLDENRPEAVAKRRRTGQRTARENLADLLDPGTLVEYGALVIAAQRRRRSVEELMERTPADGMVAGIGRVNGALFGEHGTQCVVTSYD
jgi:multidrug efflux pump subunit AcrA (membrane-fusion protein)